MKPLLLASDYAPGQRGSGVIVTRLFEWGGENLQGRDGGKCALNCPFIESFPPPVLLGGSVWAVIGWVTHFPWCGWYLLGVCFGPLLVVSRWSYPSGQSMKG